MKYLTFLALTTTTQAAPFEEGCANADFNGYEASTLNNCVCHASCKACGFGDVATSSSPDACFICADPSHILTPTKNIGEVLQTGTCGPPKAATSDFIYCESSEQCMGEMYNGGCCSTSWVVDGDLKSLDKESQAAIGSQICAPSHSVDIMDMWGNEANMFDYMQYAFENYPEQREEWKKYGFNSFSDIPPAMAEGWKQFRFGAKCIDKRLKGPAKGAMQQCKRNDDCGDNSFYRGGCCGSFGFSGDLSSLDKQHAMVFGMLDKSQDWCWDAQSIDLMDSFKGQANLYEYNKALFERSEMNRNMSLRDFPEPKPKTFEEMYDMMMKKDAGVANWKNIQMMGGCNEGRIEWDMDSDSDGRRGKKGMRGERMEDMMEGDGMMMSMGNTKIMIKMGATKVAAPVAAVLGAMTLW